MNGKILLLEDDRDIHNLLTLHLENEGYRVVGAFEVWTHWKDLTIPFI